MLVWSMANIKKLMNDRIKFNNTSNVPCHLLSQVSTTAQVGCAGFTWNCQAQFITKCVGSSYPTLGIPPEIKSLLVVVTADLR